MSRSNNKRILVMMSTYNGEKYLREQINSILNQKTSYEVHLRIRDDGSKDRTCEIVEECIDRHPDRVELIRGHNLGYNGSFFSLIQGARGYDYYSLSDQDDVWADNKLQIACDAIDRTGKGIPVLYASTSYLVHDDLNPYGITRQKERTMDLYNTIVQNICPGHTQVMNNCLIELLQREIDIDRIYVYDSWIANMANLYGVLLFDNDPHTYYRQYAGNQLGSGVGKIGQLIRSVTRNKNGDGLKYRKQIEYFFEYNYAKLSEGEYFYEIDRFVNAKTFSARLKYSLSGRLYRQSSMETVLLYLAIIFGRF